MSFADAVPWLQQDLTQPTAESMDAMWNAVFFAASEHFESIKFVHFCVG
jgi:hypothetical protein